MTAEEKRPPIARQDLSRGLRAQCGAELILVDHDRLDTPSNVRRVFGSVAADLREAAPPLKVDVVGRHLEQLGLGVRIRRVGGDVRMEGVFRTVLDADIVLSGTDTHGSRAVINDLATPTYYPSWMLGSGSARGKRERSRPSSPRSGSSPRRPRVSGAAGALAQTLQIERHRFAPGPLLVCGCQAKHADEGGTKRCKRSLLP